METTLGSRVLGPRVDDSRALADVDPYLRTDRAVVPGNSAASWAAIIAGAFVAVSVSLILLALGSGGDTGIDCGPGGTGAGVTDMLRDISATKPRSAD